MFQTKFFTINTTVSARPAYSDAQRIQLAVLFSNLEDFSWQFGVCLQ